jgi:hypothetical protein
LATTLARNRSVRVQVNQVPLDVIKERAKRMALLDS